MNQKLSSSKFFSPLYTSIFKSFRILTSIAFQLPDIFSSVYSSTRGCSHKTGIKIQIEYDRLSGHFLHIHIRPGKRYERTYGSLCIPTVKANDLCMWVAFRLFHLKDLQHIHDNKTYYISRIKSNTRIYLKNSNSYYFQNGQIKKSTKYCHYCYL
ncbi:hypothetical protein COA28_24480 [Bacillus cereus]|nr:hypothetical protein COA28_24480 [Bacillus cereus]